MNMAVVSAETKMLFLDKFLSLGEEKFYKFLINYATKRIFDEEIKGLSPEMELMDYADAFVFLFRKEFNASYLDIARLFRKAAHKAYKMLLKQGKIKKSDRFLNLCQ